MPILTITSEWSDVVKTTGTTMFNVQSGNYIQVQFGKNQSLDDSTISTIRYGYVTVYPPNTYLRFRNTIDGNANIFFDEFAREKTSKGSLILGSLQAVADLNNVPNPQLGDSYIVGTNIWFYDGDSFVDGGNIRGIQGQRGLVGPQGEIGPIGPQGPVGQQGPQGVQGARGEIGPTGLTGPQGQRGLTGNTGATGPQGPAGATGPQGPQGLRGETGPAGPQGLTGATGAQGIQGETGPQGEIGPQGATGLQGPQGIQGEIGPQGTRGIEGAQPDHRGRKVCAAKLDLLDHKV